MQLVLLVNHPAAAAAADDDDDDPLGYKHVAVYISRQGTSLSRPIRLCRLIALGKSLPSVECNDRVQVPQL
jgi:hypothetical protein